MSIVLKRFVFTIVYKNKHVYSNSITFYSISVSPYMPLWVWLWSYKKIIWSVNHHHHRFSLSNTGPVSHGRRYKNGMEMTEKERKWKIAHWHSSINTMPCDAGTMISFNGSNENRIFMDFFHILKNVSRKWLFNSTNWDYFASVFIPIPIVCFVPLITHKSCMHSNGSKTSTKIYTFSNSLISFGR